MEEYDMGNLVVIGNGFDLHHELETTVGDFISSVVCENEKNFFLKYYSMRILDRKFTWIDFEQEIAYVLINVDKMYKNVIFVESGSIKYLSVNPSEFTSPDEMFFLQVLRSLDLKYFERNGSFGNTIPKKFSDTWYMLLKKKIKEDYIEFIRKFNEYILEIDTQICNLDQKINLNENLLKIIRSSNEILNFNYTSTVEHYLLNNNPRGTKIKHVHNKVGENIIIGIHELEEHNSEYNAFFYKTMNQIIKVPYDNKVMFAINDFIFNDGYKELNMYFIGHSFGLSDHYLFDDLRKFIVGGKVFLDYFQIYFFEYDENSVKSFLYNLKQFLGTKIVDTLSNRNQIHFLNY